MVYVPKPYRPKLFPRLVRWFLLALGCIAFVALCVLLSWELSAFTG